MTTIRTVCTSPDCGSVDVSADEVDVDIEEHRYRFTCPSCLSIIEKPTDPKIEALLITAGCRVSSALPNPDMFAAWLDTPLGEDALHDWIKEGDL